MKNGFIIAYATLAAVLLVDVVAAQTTSESSAQIVLQCADRSMTGNHFTTYIFIDPARKYVKVQEPRVTLEYRDGLTSNLVTRSTLAITTLLSSRAKQRVVIDDSVIKLTATFTNSNQTVVSTIDRRTGLWIVDNDAPRSCSLLRNKF